MVVDERPKCAADVAAPMRKLWMLKASRVLGLPEELSEVGQAGKPGDWSAICEAEERCAVGRLRRYSAGSVAAHGSKGAQWATNSWDVYPLAPCEHWSVFDWRIWNVKCSLPQWMLAADAWTRASNRSGDGDVNSLMQRKLQKASERAAASMCQSCWQRDWECWRAESRSASTRVVIGLRGGEVGGLCTRLAPHLANWEWVVSGWVPQPATMVEGCHC